jgi:uncharacterized surface protein with fasciclin (FAS1) repeats
MRLPRLLVTAIAALAVTGTALATAPAASAAGKTTSPGTASLAALLTSDGNTFDKNAKDYDIVTEAVLAVLAAKPKSPVGLLADGSVALTAFVPTDQAFRVLVKDLTGKTIKSEKKVFEAVAGLGIDTVETVLLYHVIPGATITKKAALKADGAALTTAQGGTVTVAVRHICHRPYVKLIDHDPDARDPRIVQFNLNKGNLQIAHGINRVLRPLDL